MRTRHRNKPERLVAYVKPELKRLAERIAERKGVSVSTLVALALSAYLEPKGGRT